MKKNKSKLSPVDKKIFTYWQAFYMAFYSRRLYIDVAKRWRGYGLGYLFLVISLTAIPISLKTIYEFNQFYDQQLMAPLKKIPDFTLRQGRLVFDNFMPYLIKNAKGEVVVIIDEAATLTTINLIYPQWMIFINADHLYFHPPRLAMLTTTKPTLVVNRSQDIIAQSFKDIDFEWFNAPAWLEATHLEQQKWLFIMLLYPLVTAGLFGLFAGLLFFMIFVGQIASQTILKFKVPYKQACRLMMVSSSCGISLFILSLNYDQDIPLRGFFLLVTMICYFCFAVLTLKRESRGLVLA